MNGSPSGSPLWSYETLRSSLELDEKGFFAVFHDFRLDSHFQPIVSLTHARVIGHEGLIRPTLLASSEQRPIPPHLLLHRVEDDLDQLIELDRLCRLLHIANAGDAKQGWLFLNIHPRVFVAPQRGDIRSFTTLACNDFGLKREHVVLELLEHALIDETEFADAIRNMRENGYLVALDDFGAGHSNFDRVWKVSPEIVKLDRVFAIGAESDPRIRRLLPRIVALLHEAGVFVLLEGIETRTQAMITLDANIDFAQGDYFARPQPDPLPIHSVVPAAAELWKNYESNIAEREKHTEARLSLFKTALQLAAEKIARGATLADACAGFLALPDAECCYLLDSDGRKTGGNLWSANYTQDSPAVRNARYAPVSQIGGARWSRRPYFRNATENVGQPQASSPYLSSSSAHVCITVSLAFQAGERLQVVCGDILWESPPQ